MFFVLERYAHTKHICGKLIHEVVNWLIWVGWGKVAINGMGMGFMLYLDDKLLRFEQW